MRGPAPPPDPPYLWCLRQLAYRPLLLLAAGMAVGIVMAERLAVVFSLPLLLGAAATVLLALLGPWRGVIQRIALPLVVACAAGAALQSLQGLLPRDHLSRVLPLNDVSVTGWVAETPRVLPGGTQLIVAELETLETQGVRRVISGKASLFAPPESPRFVVGQRFWARASHLRPFPPALNPGETDERRARAREGVYAEGSLQDVRRDPRAASPSVALGQFLVQRQRLALQNFIRAMPGPEAPFYAGLFASMVFGQRAAGGIDAQTRDLFRRTGTVHLLVVSGAQITFIIFAVILLVSGAGRRALSPWNLALIAPPLVGFALFAGLSASVGRALVMAGLLAYALVGNRRYDALNALGLAALVLMLADPGVVFDIGAQLTFAAAGGVTLFIPPGREYFGVRTRVGEVARATLFGTLGAWVMTTPIVVATFHGMPLLGALANVVALPVSFMLMPLGMAALVTGSWLHPLTVAFCWAGRALLTVLLAANRVFQHMPGGYADLVHFGPVVTVAWYALLGGGLLLVARPEVCRRLFPNYPRRALSLTVVGAGLAIGLGIGGERLAEPPRLRVEVLAVGEGLCVLVRSPSGRALLMDAGRVSQGGGRSLAERIVVPVLAQRGVRRLQAVVVTHAHADHCNALPTVLERVPVGLLLGPRAQGPPGDYEAVLAAARSRGTPQAIIGSGQTLDLGRGVTAVTLAPASGRRWGSAMDPGESRTASPENEASAALLVRYGDTAILLMGDQGKAGVMALVSWARENGVSLRSQVVLLPHHGRKLKWSRDLLAAAQPGWMVASGAKKASSRGEPGASRVVYTAEAGAVLIESDGEHVGVRSFLGEEQ